MNTRNKRIKRKKNVKLLPYAYLSPALISILVLNIFPIAYTVNIAFTNYNLYHLNNWKYVGLKNFKEVLTGPFKVIFFPVFGWTVLFAAIATLGTFFIGLILAMILNNKNMKESAIYKAILIIPWALPPTIATLSWQGLLDMNYGGINILLMSMHLIKEPIPWLINPFWARMGVIICTLWLGFPYMMNVCIGALSAIPDNYYEAAELDGANRWQKFTKITLPSIASATIPLLISSFAFNFNNFGAAYLITGGGPARVNTQYAGYTDNLVSSTYKMAMNYSRFDLAATISIIIFLIIGTISFIEMKFSGAFEEVD